MLTLKMLEDLWLTPTAASPWPLRRIFGARRPIAESPELGMERTFARCGDFDDDAFEQRAEP